MKTSLMNKRKFKLFFVLVFLMGIILSTGFILKNNLRCLSFIENDVKNLKEFNGLNNHFSYKLPNKWNTSIKDIQGNEIIYHNEFKSNDLKVSGFVQVWNNQKNLKDFLNKSKKVGVRDNKIKNYKISEIKLGEKPGYNTIYNVNTKSKEYIVNEYFISYKDGFVRFSFFSSNDNYTQSIKAMYDSIVSTIRLK